MIYLCIVLFLALAFACYKWVIYKRACADWGVEFRGLARDYKALDEGMTELGESMQADLLDAKEKRDAAELSLDIANSDRLLLYRMASRCHEHCLPTFHGYSDEEIEVLAYMQNQYGPAKEIDFPKVAKEPIPQEILDRIHDA